MPARPDLEERVARERLAHGERDVLAANRRLKSRFPHIETYPARLRTFGLIDQACADLQGLRVLDLGCGEGDRTLRYVAAGAFVHGIDISEDYVARARTRLAAAGLAAQAELHVMNAHELDYPDGHFDRVVGYGILHHLDWHTALAEVRRVLTPRGRAYFQEPLLDNPLLRVFRWLTPGARTADERPFSEADLRTIESLPEWRVRLHGCGLLSAPLAMLTSKVPGLAADNALLRLADRFEGRWADRALWRSWNQYVVLALEPAPESGGRAPSGDGHPHVCLPR